MKLIIQKIDGSIFAYTESEKHHKVAEPQRSGRPLSVLKLDQECDLGKYDNFYMVVDIKKPKKGKKKK